jgi:hypothetical protein
LNLRKFFAELCGWRAWLNETTVTLGTQNVLAQIRRLPLATLRAMAMTNSLPRSKSGSGTLN